MSKSKVTLIITAWNEATTVAKALELYAKESDIIDEVIVVCPDRETRAAAEEKIDQFSHLTVLKDPQTGKQAALNMAIEAAKGDICICTDGDVIPGAHAVEALIHTFRNPVIGLTTGQPLSSSPRNTMLGFWSHFLVHAAHIYRIKRDKQKESIVGSGYLLAFRKKYWVPIPEGVLSDDAFISYSIWNQGKITAYTPKATVLVAYPTNYKDWVAQKRRSQGGFSQLETILPIPHNPRSTREEIKGGVYLLLSFPKSIQEYFWILLLCFARLHIWILVWNDRRTNIYQKKNIWTRIESTKDTLQ